MEICKKCGGSNLSSSGLCKDCRNAYMREWNRRNSEKVKVSRENRSKQLRAEENRRYREKHGEQIREGQKRSVEKNREHYQEYKRTWYLANRDRQLALIEEARKRRKAADPEGERAKRAAYMRKRCEEPKHRIYKKMSSLVRKYLARKKIKKGSLRWETLVGYTLEQLIEHLKGTIPEGYTWQDYLNATLQLDHINPANGFDIKEAGDDEFRRCWALQNLRLLTRKDNLDRRYRAD